MTPFASNIINIPISEKQKWNLLFNVNKPLELLIEKFDKEWWPLVSNIWTGFSYKNNVNNSSDHSHSIKDNEKLKCTKVICELVIQEAVKNYCPPEIINAVKEIATEKLDLDECVKELRWKEVMNIKYKIRGPLDTHLVSNSRRELDIQEAISFLKNKGYLIERYEIPDLSTYDTIVACLPCMFAILMDVRTLGPTFSNIEFNAIKIAFLDFKNGEQECDILFCTVHVMRTWMNKIYKKKTRQKMLLAMHKRMRIGCESLIQEVINELTSTNALESYHSELKRTTSPKHGLIDSWTSEGLDLLLVSHYHHITNNQFEEILLESNITRSNEIATMYGLCLQSPILNELKRERHFQLPQDVYHLTAGKVLKFLKITIEALLLEGKSEFINFWKSFEYLRI
ncbi:hypothetical protein C1645_836427 [Glomus cerebriforme]|uniref:MULE transposase domain-containing protein n=1 Tax=Glomus cerebriforme TaxID=658196 RepID=A0A397S8G3_9GLOM|nr:hypothetical protein C1645_836427 [Glomus cerebriforme]